MRCHPFCRIVFLTMVLACACGLPPGYEAAEGPSQVRVSVSQGSLFVNGLNLQMPGPAQEVVKILGKPDRESRLANTILTWDNLGIYVHVEPESQQANQFTVAFGKGDMPFSPQRVFAGQVTLNELEVTPETTEEQLRTATSAGGGFWTSTHRGDDNRLIDLIIWPRKSVAAAGGATGGKEASATQNPRIMAVEDGDPLIQLAGDWALDGFVIGGGGSGFSGIKCGKISIAAPSASGVSVSTSCDDYGDYFFRLKQGSGARDFLLTVRSKIGISVEDIPIAYLDGQGWMGSRDQLLGATTQSITARVAAIAGRNWYGWTIEVLPTAELNGNPEEMKTAFLKADLTRRK